jgi:hypothetical protein
MKNLFNFGFSKKDKKRFILAQNRDKGKMSEAMFELGEKASGREVIRTGKGHDYKVRHKNPWTGKTTKTEYVEVKSSRRAPVSKLQKKTQKKMKGTHTIVRPMF